MSNSAPDTVCIACSIFRREMELLSEKGLIDFPVEYTDSMLHMHPELLDKLIDKKIKKFSDSPRILILLGQCHNRIHEQAERKGVYQVQGCNCVEIILGTERYKTMLKEGAFFFMPEWTLRWREIFEQELGLNDEIAKDFMRDMHTKLVYLDTGLVPVPEEHLEEASKTFGLPWEVLPVELEPLLKTIQDALKSESE